MRLCLALFFFAAFTTHAEAEPVAREILAHANDYTFMWWPDGWRGRSPEGHRVFCIQTNRYGLAFDVDRAAITHLGSIETPLIENDAVSQSNDVIFRLPRAQLATELTFNGKRYHAHAAAPQTDQVRIIESGRFLQRVEILEVGFESEKGEKLNNVSARYELVCWPDRAVLLLHVTPADQTAQLSLALHINAAQEQSVSPSNRELSQQKASVELDTDPKPWVTPLTRTASVVLFSPTGAESSSVQIDATEMFGDQHRLTTSFDPLRGHHRIILSDLKTDSWDSEATRNYLERVRVSFDNPADTSQTTRLIFAKTPTTKMMGIIGLTPMWRDRDGFPIGLPIQISKNWHTLDWFHGATLLELPPHSQTELEFTLCFAQWGGVPAVSHAQLCLVGWGTHQLWQEVAIGSYGESICYDPDVNLERAMIDDVRPLLVKSMYGPDRPDTQWSWTNNVGGGDFLVLFKNDQREFLKRMRSSFVRYGPNLAEVVLAGTTPDEGIDARITLFHYRTDDITRGLYHLRYDVRKTVEFRRLAFFQLGADHYNDHQFGKIARGQAKGLVQEWSVDARPSSNSQALTCEGPQAWFSLHDARLPDERKGAWANRGLIIRSWRSRLGGADAPFPYASIQPTLDRVPSFLVELTPPPGLQKLLPGDFVEADIEMAVVPTSADDYYGPNKPLRDALKKDANTWRMIWREAAGNAPQIQLLQGTLVNACPLRIQPDANGTAKFHLSGGIAYVPVTISDVTDYREFVLEKETPKGWAAIDQSVHGHDFWQSDYHPATHSWDLTFNVPTDFQADGGIRLRFRSRHSVPSTTKDK